MIIHNDQERVMSLHKLVKWLGVHRILECSLNHALLGGPQVEYLGFHNLHTARVRYVDIFFSTVVVKAYLHCDQHCVFNPR